MELTKEIGELRIVDTEDKIWVTAHRCADHKLSHWDVR